MSIVRFYWFCSVKKIKAFFTVEKLKELFSRENRKKSIAVILGAIVLICAVCWVIRL